MKTRSVRRPLAWILLSCALFYGTAQSQETEAAPTSKLTGYELPQGTERVKPNTVPADALKLLDVVIKAADLKMRRGQTEVLVWSQHDKTSAGDLRAEFSAILLGAGWRYKADEETNPDFIPFSARDDGPPARMLLGYWAPTDDGLLMVWTLFSAAQPAPVTRPQTVQPRELLPDSPRVAAPTSNTRITASPSSLLGSWRWTTISASNYYNPTTGQITDNAGGMSAGFTFNKNGTYKFNFYVRRRTYGLISESWTMEEGKVTFGKDTFTLQPTRGHYKGTGSTHVDRPMTAAERKRRSYVWRWEMRDGKKVLLMGPGESSLSIFKPEK